MGKKQNILTNNSEVYSYFIPEWLHKKTNKNYPLNFTWMRPKMHFQTWFAFKNFLTNITLMKGCFISKERKKVTKFFNIILINYIMKINYFIYNLIYNSHINKT